MKPAYRITLRDRTEIVASDDHRFLTERGWKFVTGAENGRMRRPFLTEGNELLGTGHPAITRKRDIEGQAIKNDSQLGVVAIEAVGVSRLFDITTGTGDFIANGVVSHNCYARRTHWFMDEDGVDGWSSKIFVKANAPQVLRQELGRPAWKRELVALGTATDPYQPIEGHYRITRRILEALRDFRTPVSIVTRSPLILRDIDILTDMARRVEVTICVSIATTDPDLAHQIEPTVAPPAQRLRTVERLAGSGVRTGVLLAPVLPGLTDGRESLAAVIEAAGEAGASFVGHRVLYLGDVTKDAFLQFLAGRYPDLLPRYRQMYRGQYAPAAYERHVKRVVDLEKERTAKPFAPRYLRPPEEPQQLELF
jgi:DNA repair photolyase